MAISNAVTLANFSSGDALTVDSINDRVGIASTTPTEALTVVGVVSATSFSGSGANLTDVISGVETKEGGTSKGTSQTSLNFVGATVAASGAESTITVTSIPTQITVADESSDTTCFPLFVTAATGNLAPKSGSNLAFNSSNGTLTATSFAGALTGNATGLTGTPNISCGTVSVPDLGKFTCGASDDLQIYHFPDGNANYIDSESTNTLYIRVNDENAIVATANAEVKLYHDNSKKLETTSSGAKFTGHLRGDDNNRLQLGDNQDLQIWNLGDNSYIRNGVGALYIDAQTAGDDVFITNNSQSHYMAKFLGAGAVELYHNNSKKFETTSSGVTVTGDLNSTSDINLKKDIEVVSSATEMVNQLRGVKFTWKENDEKSVGVIAQEVENILPELVKGEEGEKSVNYSGLVGVLIEAVKELTEEVNTLKSQLNK